MRVLVTGGAGFIGSHVVDALIARDDEVAVIDDLSGGRESNLDRSAQLFRADIRTQAATDLVLNWRPEAIAHLAAQVSVSRSAREPVLDAEINVMGSLRLILAALEVGARFVFSSTGGAFYGDTEVLPTPESHPAWPASPYGVSKLTVEHYLHSFGLIRGLKYTALRYGNVYGPRQDPHGEAGVVAIFAQAHLGQREAVIHGDGSDTRDYVYVSDVAAANLLALDAAVVGHFNVGTGVPTDTNAIFRTLKSHLGSDLQERHGPRRPGDLHASCLDASRIRQELGWSPQVDVTSGLAATARWFREQAAASLP